MTGRDWWVGTLVVALALVALHVWFGGCRYSRHMIAKYTMKYTAEGIAAFHTDHGRLPENLEEAVICGSYLGSRGAVDPWRRNYFYQRNERGFALLSLAQDGLLGGSGEDADLMIQGALAGDKFVYW